MLKHPRSSSKSLVVISDMEFFQFLGIGIGVGLLCSTVTAPVVARGLAQDDWSWPSNIFVSLYGIAQGDFSRGLPATAPLPPSWLVFTTLALFTVGILAAALAIVQWRKSKGTEQSPDGADFEEAFGEKALQDAGPEIRPDLGVPSRGLASRFFSGARR